MLGIVRVGVQQRKSVIFELKRVTEGNEFVILRISKVSYEIKFSLIDFLSSINFQSLSEL